MHAITAQSTSLPFQPQPPETKRYDTKHLACLSDISERGGLAELYMGATLLKLSRVPRPPSKPRCRQQWLQAEDYDGPIEFTMVGHGNNACQIPHPGEWRAPARSPIAGFSRQSRMRLLCKLNMIATAELPRPPKFVTLTYPRELLPSWQWAKRQLHHFLIRFFRRYGPHPVVWRMEHQEDGAIHFHLMVFIERFVPWWWIAQQWDALIGNQVRPIDSASTEIRQLRSWRQAGYYMSKYIAKESDRGAMDIFNGRHWGTRNWRLLPVHRVLVALTEAEFYAMRRWTRRLRLARGVRTMAFGDVPEFCGTREIGITAFISAVDAWRMIEAMRGYGAVCLSPPATH